MLVTVTFPEDYRAAELAGKPAEFKCHVLEIREKTPYELDDVFAKEVGGCETLAEMKEKLRQSYRRTMMTVPRWRYRTASCGRPPRRSTIRRRIRSWKPASTRRWELLKAQLGQKGLTLDAYLQFTGQTEQKLREDASRKL